MSNRLIVKCTSCQTSLAVSPDSTGKKIRCPRCQMVQQVDRAAAKSSPIAARSVSRPEAARPHPATSFTPLDQTHSTASKTAHVYIDCGQCGSKLAILIASTATAFRCPTCGHINRPEPLTPRRAEARPLATPSVATTTLAATSSPLGTTPPARTSPPHQSMAAVGSPRSASPALPRGHSSGPVDYPPFGNHRVLQSPTRNKTAILSWAKRSWMVLLIAVLNLLFFIVSALALPNGLYLGTIQLAVGLILAGLLLLPRLHLVSKAVAVTREFLGVMGQAMAGAGLLTVTLLLLKYGSRLTRKLDNAQSSGKIDLSQLSMESLASMLLGWVVVFAVLALVGYIWHVIGIIRLAASAYILQIAVLTAILLYGYSVHGRAQSSPGSPLPSTHSPVARLGPVERDPVNSRAPIPHRVGDPLTPHMQAPAVHLPNRTGPWRGPHRHGSNPWGKPAEEVATIILQHYRYRPDEANILEIQSELIDDPDESHWQATQGPGEWVLLIQYSDSIHALNEWVRSKNLTKTVRMDESQRTLVLQPL